MKYEKMMICEGCGQAFPPNRTGAIPSHTRLKGHEKVHLANESECMAIQDELGRIHVLQAQAGTEERVVDWQSSTNS